MMALYQYPNLAAQLPADGNLGEAAWQAELKRLRQALVIALQQVDSAPITPAQKTAELTAVEALYNVATRAACAMGWKAEGVTLPGTTDSGMAHGRLFIDSEVGYARAGEIIQREARAKLLAVNEDRELSDEGKAKRKATVQAESESRLATLNSEWEQRFTTWAAECTALGKVPKLDSASEAAKQLGLANGLTLANVYVAGRSPAECEQLLRERIAAGGTDALGLAMVLPQLMEQKASETGNPPLMGSDSWRVTAQRCAQLAKPVLDAATPGVVQIAADNTRHLENCQMLFSVVKARFDRSRFVGYV